MCKSSEILLRSRTIIFLARSQAVFSNLFEIVYKIPCCLSNKYYKQQQHDLTKYTLNGIKDFNNYVFTSENLQLNNGVERNHLLP